MTINQFNCFRNKAFFLMLTVALASACSDGPRISSAAAPAKKTSIAVPDSLVKKQLSGIDFYAKGNDPLSWTLEMDIDKGYYFKSSDGISLNIPAVKPIVSADRSYSSYTHNSNQGDLTISIFFETCRDKNFKKVEVSLNNTRYIGCGNYLYNPQLNGKWLIEKAGAVMFAATDFPRGLPVFEFNVSAGVLGGNDGCGNITAPITIYGSRISIASVSFKSADCSNSSIQKIIREKLSNQTTDYFFKDGKLVLYLIDDSQITLRKAT